MCGKIALQITGHVWNTSCSANCRVDYVMNTFISLIQAEEQIDTIKKEKSRSTDVIKANI